MSTSRPLATSVLLTLLPLSACFSTPEDSSAASGETLDSSTSGDGDGDGDATASGDGDGDGDGDATASGDGDGDGDEDTSGAPAPPSFVSFTVNDSLTPALVEAASAVIIEAEVEDPNDDIAYIVFKRNGETISTQDSPGPNYSFEWIVSGAELNGEYSFEAEVYDDNAAMAAAGPINLALGMPLSGEVEAWSYDSGEFDAIYGLSTDPEGEEVVLTGQSTLGLASQIRTDRVVGDSWSDKTDPDSFYGASVTRRADGGFFVVGARAQSEDDPHLDSTLFRYDSDGVLIDILSFDASSQPNAGDTDNAIRAGRAPQGVWVMGAYNPAAGPNAGDWLTYLRRYTDALDVEYTRHPSEALAGRPFAYDMSVATDGSLALAGGQFAAQPIRPWFGRFDPSGELVAQTEIDDFDGGILHAVHLGDDGSVVVGGQATQNGQSRAWLRSYAPNGTQRFESVFPASELGVVADVVVDAWGEVVAVSTEGCTAELLRYVDCDLVVRKLDAEGFLLWEERYESGFVGPVFTLLGFDATVELDRYGYVYVTAIPEGPQGTDWWARKLHP